MLAWLFDRVIGFPRDHWRGGHSLVVTLLITVVGLRILTAAVLPLMSELRGVVVIGLWIAGNAAILTWQTMGIWRATERHLAKPTDTVAAWGGYFTILVAGVLAAVQTIDGVVMFTPTPRAHSSETAKPLLPVEDGHTVRLRGDLNYDLNAAFELTLERTPSIRRVILESAGGHIFAARAVANNIIRLGLDTHVEARCFSACTLAFMAGRHRTIEPSGQLGFHKYAIPGELRVKILDVQAEQRKDRSYFANRGVSEAFLEKMFQARHSQIWIPSHDVLRDGGVLKSTDE